MRVGKISSLVLALALAGGGAFVWKVLAAIPFFAQSSQVARTWMLIALSAVVSAIVLVPVGVLCDRAIVRLRLYIENATNESPAEAASSLPRWLQPVSRAVLDAAAMFKEREEELRREISTLEIRHHVAETLRRQIEAVLHSIRDPVIVTDPYREIVMANDAAAELFEFDLSEALHQPLEKIIADAPLCSLIGDAREQANFVNRRHVEYHHEDATETHRVFDVVLSCVENHRHEVGAVVAILHDVTREQEISRLKSDFVAKASHELRTPLSSIQAYVEMLLDGEAENEKDRAEFCRIIHAETERLGRLIDNMLNISRIEAGIIQVERERVDLKNLIRRAVDSLEPQAREKNISLLYKFTEVDLTVEGDPDMLYQVGLNLLSNAVKYTPEGGRIIITADSDNLTRSVLVTVSDTGLGIPPDALPKLFDKFYRVENYKRMAKGTGLGLNLCRHIVETLHRGQIGVETELGMGSKFWFSVPMRFAGSNVAA